MTCAGIMTTPQSFLSDCSRRKILLRFIFITAILTWPVGLSALARSLRWPQFIRPLSLTLVAFALSPIYLLTGGGMAAALSGTWAGLIHQATWPFSIGLPWDLTVYLIIVVFFQLLGVHIVPRKRRLAGGSGVPPTGARRRAERPASPGSCRRLHVGRLCRVRGAIGLFCLLAGIPACEPVRPPDRSLPGRAEANYAEHLAGFRLSRSDPSQAERHLGNAIPLWEQLVHEVPSESSYLVNLGNAYGNLGDALAAQGKLDDAVAAYRHAIRLKPKNATAHTDLGYALAAQGKLDDAVAACRQAIRLETGDAAAHAYLGYALRQQGKLADAIYACQAAIRLRAPVCLCPLQPRPRPPRPRGEGWGDRRISQGHRPRARSRRGPRQLRPRPAVARGIRRRGRELRTTTTWPRPIQPRTVDRT